LFLILHFIESLLGHLGGFVAGGLVALALVYAPGGSSRSSISSRRSMQILALVVLLAVMVGLVAYRTHVLLGG